MAAQVLTTSALQFVPTQEQLPYGHDGPPSFGSGHSGHPSYSSHNVQQPPLMASPQTVHRNPSIRGQRQASRSPRVNPSAATFGDRTPIRHYSFRAGAARGRSLSRSEAFLEAYAQQSQLQLQQMQSSTLIPTIPSQPDLAMPSPMYNEMPTTYSMQQPLSMTAFPAGNDMVISSMSSNPRISQRTVATMQQRQRKNEEVDLQGFYASAEALTPSSGVSMMDIHQQPPPQPTSDIGPSYALYRSTGRTQDGGTLHQPPPAARLPSNTLDDMQQPFPPPANLTLESTPTPIELKPSRPKPQCWDHGCNGRQFSTFSNLLRHQREKSGSAAKAVCPHCGTEFTRTTARNGHLSGGKCKGMADLGSEAASSSAQE
ncbi:hypothetical protein ABEF92_002983 [Exophiala dermatitidis]|uniref:C2H2-type domain-containing protein n=1 Tax=Exophiala dermatitidis (strain ATCC 34100 / CBS 525.76 / NIH/UT8656) TaxID=858893 RepID=H6C2Z1_EXODN|nr:uncharacterized protein HMPREF1120_06024 [Exophiala dermatitidis NIH/UT8656]EHY58006.1 hypothetical protein HMPREF1120_06024 [Exophiala dermatitidis NIH/UT8656]